MPAPHIHDSPFSLLTLLAGDAEQAAIFAEESTIQSMLAAERALALAQAEHGVLTNDHADAIVAAARIENIDTAAVWSTARVVGYPVLGLVRQVAAVLPPGPDGRVHYGATTQDIMDTGLALQLARSLAALDRQLGAVGDALAARVQEHADTVMAARTHAQQAVPTTYGATLGTWLAQLARHRERLAQASPRIARVSLFGAGGTSAALGPHAGEIRDSMARLLELNDPELPWHVDRDGIAEYGWLCATITAACAKFARNIIDLSRTEIAEVFEPFENHRGASSTMPQKVNPIAAELIIGASGAAGSLTSSLLRMQEAGHERAAGEWQLEWHVIPQLGVLASTALRQTRTILEGLRVDAARMKANLTLDGGLVMAEAHMIGLAQALGRERAHDLIYEAAGRARANGQTLTDTVPQVAADHSVTLLPSRSAIAPEDYLGEAHTIADRSIKLWRATPALLAKTTPLAELATRTSADRPSQSGPSSGDGAGRSATQARLHPGSCPAGKRIR